MTLEFREHLHKQDFFRFRQFRRGEHRLAFDQIALAPGGADHGARHQQSPGAAVITHKISLSFRPDRSAPEIRQRDKHGWHRCVVVSGNQSPAPVDRRFPRGGEQRIGPRKDPAAEKAAIGRQRRRMGRLQHRVTIFIDQCPLALRRSAPQDENHSMVQPVHRADHRVGERFPAEITVGIRGMSPHRKHCVQQQHALPRPSAQIAALRLPQPAEIVGQLLIDIAQARRQLHAVRHRKCQPVRLTVVMIGVLPQNHHPLRIRRRQLQRLKGQRFGREDRFGLPLRRNLRRQRLPAFAAGEIRQAGLPRLRQPQQFNRPPARMIAISSSDS
ncbi:hypothetical protein SDC9_95701 [bioreactor metagenome]|uniref:Uncharacterized protein n=1 Tax=bioreactor metagenome TaxID=1076179 RepID=A0A645AH48_9ZZZZ